MPTVQEQGFDEGDVDRLIFRCGTRERSFFDCLDCDMQFSSQTLDCRSGSSNTVLNVCVTFTFHSRSNFLRRANLEISPKTGTTRERCNFMIPTLEPQNTCSGNSRRTRASWVGKEVDSPGNPRYH